MTDLQTGASGPLVVLGRIGEAYGIRGEVRIHPFADDPDVWADMDYWWLGDESALPLPSESWRKLRVEKARVHGDGLVARLQGVTDRSSAEALRGLYVAAPREALPETDEDEYYWGDLVGLPVENLQGEPLGIVEGLLETGANDVLRVVASMGPGHKDVERLLPFVSTVVLKVELPGPGQSGRIVVDWALDW